jgi:hypothetical protein
MFATSTLARALRRGNILGALATQFRGDWEALPKLGNWSASKPVRNKSRADRHSASQVRREDTSPARKTMNLLSVVVVTASLLTLAWRQTLVHAENARPVELYVATNGNDKWSGKLATPIKSRTDGPFATVQRARDQLRTLKEKNALPGGARVLVRGGVYALKETLQFRPQDSGTAGVPIVYQNYRNEKPVLSGGTRITGWRVINDKVAGRRWIATLPDVKDGAWNFAQLFVNGERRYRPRLAEERLLPYRARC